MNSDNAFTPREPVERGRDQGMLYCVYSPKNTQAFCIERTL